MSTGETDASDSAAAGIFQKALLGVRGFKYMGYYGYAKCIFGIHLLKSLL